MVELASSLVSIPSLVVDKGFLKDSATGRNLVLRGINVAGESKLPKTASEDFWDGENVSFAGSPFSLEEAGVHLERLKKLGFNVVRFVFTWEALEHDGPGAYDEDYVEYVVELLWKLKEYGLYAFMDPHQDNWSRHCGGSGAPLWTLYALGLDPKKFDKTQAAILYKSKAAEKNHNMDMLWSSNYHRFACQLVFTLFFGGRDFAPKCILNGQNIQDYLQSHYLNAIEHFANRLSAAGLDKEVVLGWESLNEPSGGLIGHSNLREIPEDQHVRLATTPTAHQAMLLASGHTVGGVEEYIFTNMGPKKTSGEHGVTVDPEGTSVWLSEAERNEWDQHYKWERGDNWKPGLCIWAQHGVWNPETGRIQQSDYFSYDPSGKPFSDAQSAFIDNYFLDHWIEYSSRIRNISQNWFLFFQPPVNCPPPDLLSRNLSTERLVYSPHYYDGMTLMLKRWSRLFNVDAVGVLRKKYISPVFALRVGEKWIRSSMSSQLSYLKSEGEKILGKNVPCLLSEIGIPYDMDNKSAYSTKVKEYTSQIRAMDAISNALESAGLNHTLWLYTGNNTHADGDHWNGEDLSIFSQDDITEASNGIRAIEAVNRPTPRYVSGIPTNYGFNISKATFNLTIEQAVESQSAPTEIYLPEYYFTENQTAVSTSSGHWELKDNIFLWWHSSGTQTLQIKGTPTVSLDKAGDCNIQ